ncbi:MAG: c-type cytochrome [Acidobacteriota bacterium]
MKNREKITIIILSSALFLVSGAFLFYVFITHWRAKGVSSVERGKEIASRFGCFSCHGPEGIRGIKNPGNPEGSVPSWDGGTYMMYVENEKEIKEWILNGAPERLKKSETFNNRRKKSLIKMPSYKGVISSKELNDLVSFFKATAWAKKPEDPLAEKGRELAYNHGCFGCHGPEGRGSLPNPESFKGYIPAWDSKDFSELVGNDKELEEWILKGSTERLQKNPASAYFLKRQVIKMPSYENIISKEELEAIKAYINWIRQNPNLPKF